MPSTPLVVILGVGVFEKLRVNMAPIALRMSPRAIGNVTLVLAAAWGSLMVIRAEPLWRDGTADERALLADVLRFTHPGDRILDEKGETVFRRRATRLVLEGVTKFRIARGLLPDPIVTDLERTGAHFAVPDSHAFPAEVRRFLDTHFIPLGSIGSSERN